MRSILAGALGLMAAAAGQASAQTADNPVVVELYTSQGCSSCPPADAVLAELAGRDDVIALALHVDYWDYIGWKDAFADPQHTMRQKAYARAAGARSIYTPQMIVEGQDHLIGLQPVELADLIDRHGAVAAPVRLTLARSGDAITIRADALQPLQQRVMVQVVRYRPEAVVSIRRGENAGRDLTYHNIVESWESVGEWSGSAPFEARHTAAGDDPVVVIIQEPGPGHILAAARLR
jgi:hypothetical protein